MKVRICSKSQTNFAPTFIVQPPITPQSDSQPPHQYVHVPAPTIPGISDIYSENEEEKDEEAEMQAHQQRPTARKRAWLVDIIGKSLYIKFKMELCIKPLSIC